MMMKTKDLQDYLQEDASLCKKITYEQFMHKEITSNNRDYKMENAYQAYRKAVDQEYRA